jgi:hypothetical protein
MFKSDSRLLQATCQTEQSTDNLHNLHGELAGPQVHTAIDFQGNNERYNINIFPW